VSQPLLLSLPLILLVTACDDGGSGEPSNFEPPPLRQAYPCHTFNEAGTLTCSYSGLTMRERRIIRASIAWDAAWADAWGRQLSPPALPAVDFSLEMVVLAAMGEQASGGYAIEVQGVTQRQAVLDVTVVERNPGPNCLATLALTQPFTARRVPRFDGNVYFVEQQLTADCLP
jgi:PrcB C-terminal